MGKQPSVMLGCNEGDRRSARRSTSVMVHNAVLLRARGPSWLTVLGVLAFTLLAFLATGAGIVRMRESEKRVRAAETMRALSRNNLDILGQVRSDLQRSAVPSITVADQSGVRFPADDVEYRNLTIRVAEAGPGKRPRRILYAFLCLGTEVGDGRDNDCDGLVDEGFLLRWDELRGPRVIGRDLMNVTFTRRGTALDVNLCAAAPRRQALPLVQRAAVSIDLLSP